jgi:hypothetical protein
MNIEKTTSNSRTSEKGNVLFLILIAVALFAALSYAVTQSTRSGGSDASKETNLVNAAGLTQYPASIKTSITRMLISNGTTPAELLFDLPPFTALTTTALQSRGVFYPTTTSGGGGGGTYIDAPSSVMANNLPGVWAFNSENQVTNIGTSSGTTDANNADIISFLSGVKQSTCDSIHQRLGLALTYATLTGIDVSSNMNVANPGIVPTAAAIITSGVLDGQPQGCFQQPANNYVYYHVIVER